MSCSEWIEVKLEDITTNHNSLRVPLSSKERSVRKGCYPYYGAQGIIDYIDDYIFEGEYLLVAEDGANLETRNETIARLTSKGEKFWVNNHAHILRANDKSDIRYILYHLNRVDLSSYITGSAQPKLNKANLNSIQIKLPPLQEQKAIAHILSTLDEKIEVNNKINKTLEEMAQAIFKHWFVDFEFPNEDGEPYKSSGGEMVDSELGPIPKGWNSGIINDFCNVTDYVANGSFASLSQNVTYVDDKEGYAVLIRLMDFNRDFNGDFVWVDKRGYEFLRKSSLSGGEVIIANVGANAGTVFKAPRLEMKMTLGPNSIMLLNNEYSNYLYCYLTSKYGQDKLDSIKSGSAQPKFNKTDFRNIELVSPDYKTLSNFNDICAQLFEEIEIKQLENKLLKKIRDTLLPKLMSGEIRVPIDNEQ